MTNGSSFEWMQTSIFGNAWLALADNVKCKFTNGIEGIIRELIPYIPLYLLMLAYDPDEDHRPAVYAAQQIAALLYVECTHIPEAFFLSHIHTDCAMQYAIHTEHELKQPFSHRTFSRIRERFQAVYKATGRDLLQEVTDVLNTVVENEVLGNTDYSDQFAKVYRMDSMSIDMHGAHMTRLELAYVVNKMNVRAIESVKGKDEIPSELTHYLEDSDHNKVIYYKGTISELENEATRLGIPVSEIENYVQPELRKTKEDTSANPDSSQEQEDPQGSAVSNLKKRQALIGALRLQTAMEESLKIQKLSEDLNMGESIEYKHLVRLIDDQTRQDKDGKMILRANSEIKGTSLQNPYDPEATYRSKDGTGWQGYSAHVVQRCGPGNYSVIVDRDLQPSTHSDQAFAKSFYDKFGKENFDPNHDKLNAVTVDGLYCNSFDLQDQAKKAGFQIFCGTLNGKVSDAFLAGFDVDTSALTVQTCPCGYEVKRANFNTEKETIRIRMPEGTCSGCENCGKCGSCILKNGEGSLVLKLRQYNEATTILNLGHDEYRDMVNKRNAVEGIPSVLRRAYHIDDVPYFGQWYARYKFMLDTTAMNIHVLARFRQDAAKAQKAATPSGGTESAA